MGNMSKTSKFSHGASIDMTATILWWLVMGMSVNNSLDVSV